MLTTIEVPKRQADSMQPLPPFRPLDDKLLIDPIIDEKVGRIHMPHNVEGGRVMRGRVLAVGPGLLAEAAADVRHTMAVRVGDTVWVQDICAVPVELAGRKLRVAREAQLLGHVTGGDE